jgi:hypothetical protein
MASPPQPKSQPPRTPGTRKQSLTQRVLSPLGAARSSVSKAEQRTVAELRRAAKAARKRMPM